MKHDQVKIDKSSWDEIHVDGWFKGLIPPEWEIEDDDEVIIYDPAGFGELRLNMFVKNNNRSRKQRAFDVVNEWAKELGSSYEIEVSFFKRSRGLIALSAEFVGSEPDGEMIFWRIFPVVGEKLSLDISYSCSLEDRNREETVIENIIDSITLLETAENKIKVPLTD
ncbi:MAG: hypothetical protein JSU85_14220 [Candidatus Zixiibacteriota bacterium]|nr:MAG: hypothetical protein JSU85_14220 [candidate division Zixibacteria bacterium]